VSSFNLGVFELGKCCWFEILVEQSHASYPRGCDSACMLRLELTILY